MAIEEREGHLKEAHGSDHGLEALAAVVQGKKGRYLVGDVIDAVGIGAESSGGP
jgi:hypothetical protein